MTNGGAPPAPDSNLTAADPTPDPFGDADERVNTSRHAALSQPPVWPPKPGIFAVVWPLYLLVGGIAAAAPFLDAKYVDDTIAIPAIVAIVCAFTVGLTVLLPLMRLSQAKSTDPVLESAMDAFSLLLPVQPLLWFTVVRPIGFGAGRVMALDLAIVGWTALIAGLVGVTLLQERGHRQDASRRTLAMAVVVLLQVAGPAAHALLTGIGAGPPRHLASLGPVAAVLEVLSHPRDPAGMGLWIGVGVVWMLGAGVWWIALGERRSVLSGGRRPGLPAEDI